MPYTHTHLRVDDKNAPHYSVYTYSKSDRNSLTPKWEKVSGTRNMKRAIRHAKLLNYRRKYERVEIQKRFFCKSRKKVVGKTFRTYEPRDNFWLNVVQSLSFYTSNKNS